MQQIKFLANCIKENLHSEDVVENIICNISKLGICENQTFNKGEYNVISPDDMLISCKLDMNIDSKKFDVVIHKQTYKMGLDQEVNTLEVTILSRNQEEIYDFKVKVKDILKKYYKEIFILMDTHNQILCSQLYSEIYKIENRFRELINSYMVKKYGVAWFKENIKDEFQTKSKQYSGWYNRQYVDFKDIQSEIFNLQTDDLIKMLEKSYINQLNKADVDSITLLKDKLKDNAKLVLQEKYLNLKSIWDTDIKNILPENFNDIWKEFSNMRNMIAHNKPICKMLQDDIQNMIKKLDEILDQFNSKINTKLTSLEKQEAKRINDEINDDFCCEESGIDKLGDRDDVLDEIREHNQIQELYSSVEEFILNYCNLLNELEECINELSSNKFDKYNILDFSDTVMFLYGILNKFGVTQDQAKIEIIKKSISENIRELVTEDIVSLFGNIKFDTDCISQSTDFDENITIFSYTNIFSEYVEVETVGDICIQRGYDNEFLIKMFLNDKKQAESTIIKSYGEYEMNEEQGYAMPTQLDDLDVDLKEVLDNLNTHFEETLSELKNINEYLASVIFE